MKTTLHTIISAALISSASAVTIGVDFSALGTLTQDTPSNGTDNQMRQNINITNTVFLAEGDYQVASWGYIAADDSVTGGVSQEVFPFLTLFSGSGNHEVLVSGDVIITTPGTQTGVTFGANNTFSIGVGGATLVAGIQNPSGAGAQNNILTDENLGKTDHANSLDFDDAAVVGGTLDSFGHGNLTRTYAFNIDVVAVPEPSTSLLGLAALCAFGARRRR